MRIGPLLLGLAVLACSARSARAQVFVGPNLEWNYLRFAEDTGEDSGSMLSVGGYYINPGLRLGYLFPGAGWTVWADTGIQSEHFGSFEYTSIIVQPTVSYLLQRERATSPYLALAGGVHHSGYSFEKLTRFSVGGAVGVRHRIAAGHGAIRGEFRYDYYPEEDTKGFILPQSVIGLRLGCDLLFAR